MSSQINFYDLYVRRELTFFPIYELNWTLYEHFKVLNTPIDFQLPAKQQKRFTDTDRMTDKRL